MGYEITFSFHEKNEEGKMDMETSSTFTKTVGKRNEEVSLEKVGAIILGQMARRDIYISNVTIFEYVKREVSFKETKTGITIKNKKFSFDQLSGELKAEEDMPAPQVPAPQVPQRRIEPTFDDMHMPSLRGIADLNDIPDLRPRNESSVPDSFIIPANQIPEEFKPTLPPNSPPMPMFNQHVLQQASQKLKQQQQPSLPNNIPIRHEVFRPNKEDYNMLQRQGFRLTMGRPYPLFRESSRPTSRGDLLHYTVIDDGGNRVEVSSSYFEPMRRGLIGMENGDPQITAPEGKLSYVDYATSGVISNGGGGGGGSDVPPMPLLRRNF